MTKEQIFKRMAYLESLNDYLITEVEKLDSLMRLVGFTSGIESLKKSAEEIISQTPLYEEEV